LATYRHINWRLSRAYIRVGILPAAAALPPSSLLFLAFFFGVHQVCFQYFPCIFSQYGRNSLEKSRNRLENLEIV
jgi:hypothetical protein